MWTVFFVALSALLATGSMLAALSAVRIARAAAASAAASSRLPESALQSLRESIRELGDTQLELANRIKMMKVRNASSHTDDRPKNGALPDPYKDPDAWRAAVNAKLARQRVGL